MLSAEFRKNLDELWDEFWPATEVKPFAVIDFINSVFFLRFLEEEDQRRGNTNFLGNRNDSSIYGEEQQRFKWSAFQCLDKNQLYQLFNRPENNALHFAKSREEYKPWPKFLEEGTPLVAVPELLLATVNCISKVDTANEQTRDVMNEYLLKKMAEPVPPKTIPVNNAPAKTFSRLSGRWNVAAVLLTVFISGFTFAYFYSASKKKIAEKTIIGKIEKDSAVVPVQASNTADEKKPEKKSSSKKKAAKPSSNTTSKSKSGNAERKAVLLEGAGNIKGQYKIVSKAYFHNKPDESTRRNAFVVHWNNAYATLNALDEENGFVYVVFKNDQNQTSKGWLRKKDLKPVD